MMKKFTKAFLLLLLSPCMAMAQKYVGGDISLLPTYEEHGVRYLDRNGAQVQPLEYFGQAAQWNAMRVRLFVDPCWPMHRPRRGREARLDYVDGLCKRIKAAGYALMPTSTILTPGPTPDSTARRRPGTPAT
jgi:arabinogalactan endo-1,4-beta-galactosidase